MSTLFFAAQAYLGAHGMRVDGQLDWADVAPAVRQCTVALHSAALHCTHTGALYQIQTSPTIASGEPVVSRGTAFEWWIFGHGRIELTACDVPIDEYMYLHGAPPGAQRFMTQSPSCKL